MKGTKFGREYSSTKRYGHEEGLSCCFRQWRAESHCNQLHGYALSFKFTFKGNLDDRNWVVDFGGLKSLKTMLHGMFDHTLAIAKDDPMLDELSALGGLGCANVVVLDSVGCESFAREAALMAQDVLKNMGIDRRVRLVKVKCAEHGANSAIYHVDA